MSKRKKKPEPKRVIVECPDINAQLSALRHNIVAIESALLDQRNYAERIEYQLRRIAENSGRYTQSRVADAITGLRHELMGELRLRRGWFREWLLDLRQWWRDRVWRRHVKAVEEKSVDLKAEADEIAERNPNGRWE